MVVHSNGNRPVRLSPVVLCHCCVSCKTHKDTENHLDCLGFSWHKREGHPLLESSLLAIHTTGKKVKQTAILNQVVLLLIHDIKCMKIRALYHTEVYQLYRYFGYKIVVYRIIHFS